MALTTARFRDHGVDLAIHTLLRGRTIEGFRVGSTSRAPNLKRDCTANNEPWGNSVCRGKMYKTPTGDHSLLRVCFAFALRFELVGGALGSGGSPTEQARLSNPRLKGADRSVGSESLEVQCALLTLAFLRRSPSMQDLDRKPHEQSGNVILRHDGSQLSERGNWVLSETPTLTRKRREYKSGQIAWTSSAMGKVSISPITLVENIECSQVQPAQRCQS